MDVGEHYQACYACDLLFAVDTHQLVYCPRCDQQLHPYEDTLATEALKKPPVKDWDDRSDGHTRLVSAIPTPTETNELDQLKSPKPTDRASEFNVTSALLRDAYGLDTHVADESALSSTSELPVPPTTTASIPSLISGDEYEGDLTEVISLDDPTGSSIDLFDDLASTRMLPPAMFESQDGMMNGRAPKPTQPPPIPISAFEEPTERNIMSRDSGPDPTPRNRVPKKARPIRHLPNPGKAPRKTLDHAQPQPLRTGPSPQAAQSGTSPGATDPRRQPSSRRPARESSRNKSLFDTHDKSDLTDALANVVDSVINDAESGSPAEIAPPPDRQGTSTLFRILILSFTATALGIGVALIMTRTPEKQSVSVVAADPVDKLQSGLLQLGIRPLPIQSAESVRNQTFIALGRSAVKTSLGPIPGLSSVFSLNGQTMTVNGKQVFKPLLDGLKTVTKKRSLLIALEPNHPVKHLALVGETALQAGFPEVGLIVERVRDGLLGYFPFSLGLQSIPSAGYASIRIGQLGVYADILGRDGSKISKDRPAIPRLGDGSLDLAGLDKRLALLSQNSPLVRIAAVLLSPDSTIAEVMALVRRIRFGPEKERFIGVHLLIE